MVLLATEAPVLMLPPQTYTFLMLLCRDKEWQRHAVLLLAEVHPRGDTHGGAQVDPMGP